MKNVKEAKISRRGYYCPVFNAPEETNNNLLVLKQIIVYGAGEVSMGGLYWKW